MSDISASKMTSSGETTRDDWSNATDPKAKKRIQNRIAQRIYRVKMKQRLHELEDIVERQKLRETQQDSCGSEMDMTPNLQRHERQPAERVVAPRQMGYEAPMSGHQGRAQRASIGHREHYDLTSFNNVSLSESFSSQAWGTDQSHSHAPLSSVFPSQQRTYLTSPEVSTRYAREPSAPPSRETHHSASSLNSLPSSEEANSQSELLNNTLGLVDLSTSDFPSASSISWSLTDHTQTTPSTPNDQSVISSPPSAANKVPRGEEWMHQERGSSSDPVFPGKDAPVMEKLTCLTQCIERLGFDSFESAMASYYTTDLGESPTMANEQCLSRNSRLPALLAEMREHSKGWTTWERRGYRQEILRGAEELLVEECEQLRLDEELAAIGQGKGGDEITSDLVPLALRTFQNKGPNMWALITTLTSQSTPTRKRQDPYKVLMSLLTLCYSGDVPVSKLLAYLERKARG